MKAGDEETIEAPPAELPTSESPSGNTWKSKKYVEFIYLLLQFVESEEDSMDVEGDSESVTTEGGTSRKLRKPNTKTMRNEKNQFPVWMSSKKIKYHKRLTKKSAKRNTKEAKKTKQWKRACSL